MKHALLKTIALCAGLLATGMAHAQAYPSRAIRIVAPFPPGGPSDAALRAVADRMRVTLGQAVVVDNRPGGGGSIGADVVMQSPPDGYTLLFAGSSLTMQPATSKVGYDPVRSFTPIGQILELGELLVVRSDLPVHSVKEFIAYLKRNPGTVNFANAGTGTVTHFMAEEFKALSATNFTNVPYKGSAPAMTDLLGGRVQATFDGYSSVGQYIANGQLRALAVALPRRSSILPGVPTLIEAGLPQQEAAAWAGLLAPAGTPREIVDRLNLAVVDAVANADVQSRLRAMGGEPSSSTAEAFGERVRLESAKWPRVAASLGIKPE